jgi:phosphoribosylamine--glycine ligase
VSRDKSNNLITNGGRVLGYTGFGETISKARRNSYDQLQKVTFNGEQFRNDIANL